MALKGAGIAQCNLGCASLVLSPTCKEVGLRHILGGTITHVAMSRMDSEIVEDIRAGVPRGLERENGKELYPRHTDPAKKKSQDHLDQGFKRRPQPETLSSAR